MIGAYLEMNQSHRKCWLIETDLWLHYGFTNFLQPFILTAFIAAGVFWKV